MSPSDIFFFIFAAAAVLCGLLVVVSRNPVSSAMFLVLAVGSIAALFVLLHAYFLAAVQVLVYAGAVIVLFLFVIMLLDIRAEERRKLNKFALVTGLVSVGALATIVLATIIGAAAGRGAEPRLEGETHALGQILFSQYLLPFEAVSVLLLVAMIGVVLLSKKDPQ